MDLEQLLHKLEEAIDDTDWELVQEVVDEIREEIDVLGYTVEDTPEGPIVKRK